ncbi:MAG: thioredoxin family protein, partial [Bacteroidota bacterium]
MKRKERFYDIISGSPLVLVVFYAKWCAPCNTMHPTLKQVAKEFPGSFRVLKIDIDKNQASVQKLKIQSVPTLMIYHNGKVV